MDSLWEKIFTHTNTVNTDSNIKAQENTINPKYYGLLSNKTIALLNAIAFFFFLSFSIAFLKKLHLVVLICVCRLETKVF